MNVHTRAVVAVQWLRHEGSSFAVGISYVVYAVLQGLNFVSLGYQRVELNADFVLAGSRHFVVVNFDGQAHFFHGITHGSTDFVIVIDRRNREVTTFDARAVALVASFEVAVGIPGSLLREDFEHGTGDVGLELHFVKNEELRLGANKYSVTNAGGLQILFATLGDAAWVALIALHGRRLDDVANQNQGRLFGEGVHNRGAVIGHEDHVGSFDTFPPGNRGAVEHLAFFEEVVVDITSRHSDVLLLAFSIGEAQVYPLHVILFDQIHRFRHGFLQKESFARHLAWRLFNLSGSGPHVGCITSEQKVCHFGA